MRWFSKMIFDGGGDKDLKNKRKSRYYLYKLLNITKNFIKKIIEELKRKLSDLSIQNTASTGSVPKRFLASCKGAILIEFAVCMPILIILLFYINDLVKMKRYYAQTEFVAQQMANVLQNISRNRSNQAITLDDLKHASALAWLSAISDSKVIEAYTNVYYIRKESEEDNQEGFDWSQFYTKCPGDEWDVQISCDAGSGGGLYWAEDGDLEEQLRAETEWLCDDPNNFKIITISGATDCSEFIGDGFVFRKTNSGTGNGLGKCVWGVGLYKNQNGIWEKDKNISTDSPSSTVRWEAKNSPADIYPTLKIEDDQKKVIIETQFRLKAASAQSAFGLHLVNPKSKVPDNSMYFSSVVIFTPKPDLFNGTAPS